MKSIKKQLIPKSFPQVKLHKSAGILDDFAVRKDIKTRTLTASASNSGFVKNDSNGLFSTGNSTESVGIIVGSYNAATTSDIYLKFGEVQAEGGIFGNLGVVITRNCSAVGLSVALNVSAMGAGGSNVQAQVWKNGSVLMVGNIITPTSTGIKKDYVTASADVYNFSAEDILQLVLAFNVDAGDVILTVEKIIMSVELLHKRY